MSDEERIETDASEDAIEHEEAPIAGQPDWLAQRFARLVELAAEPDAYRDGAELQRLRRVAVSRVEPGVIEAHVRERSSRPRRVVLRSPVLPADVWDALVLSVSEHPAHQARMLAGELPEDIDDLIAGVRGDRLVPLDQEMRPECRCDDPRPWCRHAAAVALEFANSLRGRPFESFTLRGLAATEVLDRLRHQRAAAARAGGPTPAYTQRPAPGAGGRPQPLELCLDSFWNPGKALEEVDTTPRRPEVACPLLRRLGPSPFEQGKFPLLGLLATCYESISDFACLSDAELSAGSTDVAGMETSPGVD